jgi:hypothetical protein
LGVEGRRSIGRGDEYWRSIGRGDEYWRSIGRGDEYWRVLVEWGEIRENQENRESGNREISLWGKLKLGFC